MKGKLLGALVASALTVVAVGGLVLKPAAEHYVEPIIQEQLNNALNGKAEYGKVQIGWDGTARITDVVLYDDNGARVLGTPEISVSLSPLHAIMMPFTGVGAESLISTITVKEADVHLWENQDKSWNVNRLIKKRDTTTENEFRGDVNIEHANVFIFTNKGHRYQLDDVNSILKFSEYPEISGALTANLNGELIKVSGTYTNSTDMPFDMSISTDKLALTYLNEIIPSNIDGQISSGTAENVNVRIIRKNGSFRYQGSLDLDNIGASFKNYTISQGKAHLVVDNQDLTVEGGSLKLNDQFLSIAGSSDFSQESPNLNFHMEGKEINVGAFGVNDKLSGTTDADVYINGSTDKPIIHGFINNANLTYENYVITQGKAEFNYDRGVITLPNLKGLVNGGDLTGSGWYNSENKSFELYGESKSIPLSLVQTLTGYDVSGVVSGEVYAKGSNGKLDNVLSNLHGEDVSYDGITADTMDIMVEGGNGIYTVDYLNATMGKGAFTGYGTIKDQSLHLSLQGTDLPASILSSKLGHQLSGDASVTAEVNGTLTNPTVVGKVVMHQGSFDELHFNELYGDFGLENQLLTLNKFFIQDGHGSYNLNGTAELSGNKNVNLDLNLNNVRIENTIKSFTDIPATGWLSTTTHIGGTMDNPTLTGHIHMWDGSIYGKLITDISSDYTYDQQVLTVPDLVAEAYGATILAEGKMIGKQLDFTFKGNQVSLAPLLHSENKNIDGYVQLDGTVTGTLDKPVLQSTVSSDTIHINNSEISNIEGSIYASPDVIHLENLSFYEGALGHYKFQGGVRLNDNNSLYGEANVTNGNVGNILSLVGVDLPNFNGIMNGDVELSGTLDNPGVEVHGDISNTTIGEKNMGTSSVDATLFQHKLNIKKLEMPIDNGLLAAAGTADLDGDADIQVAASNVPIEDLMPLTGKDVDASGMLNFTANVSGKTKNPKVELSAELDNATYNGVTIDKVVALATMENKIININQILGQKDIYSLKVFGKIPLAAIYKNEYTETENQNPNMDMTIDVNNADLGLLPLLTPMIKNASGDLTGLIKITGTASQPQANGTVAVKNGSVHIDGVKKDLSNLNATAVFKDQQINLDANGTMGKGTATAKGVVNWSAEGLGKYNFTFNANKLDVENTYYDGPFTADFTYENTEGRPKLTGVVDIEDTKLDIPFSLDSGENENPLNIDLSINVGEKVRLYNSLLYDLTVTGNARFRGNTAKPISEGEFDVTKGYVKYLNTRFDIGKGKAKFARGSFLPYLSVNGKARVSTYNIFADISGPVSQMDMKLTSDPPLTEQQIMSLLTFRKGGNMSSQVDTEDANALLTAGLQAAVLGTLQGKLENTLGLDVLNFSTGTLDENQAASKETAGYYNVEIGKYIMPNLLVSMSKGLNYNYTVYSVQYDINSRFGLRAWRDTRENSFVGGQWHYTF